MIKRKVVFFVCAAVVLVGATRVQAQVPEIPLPSMPRGLVTRLPTVTAGYVLFSPILSTTVFLVDNDGQVVHTWDNGLNGPKS